MESQYKHQDFEQEIYDLWEKSKVFQASKDKTKKPYTILMPPPNANASLHAGHAMYTIEDVMIRYKRMQGYSALWIPGRDHAGFETQYVYEKHLAKEGKSRMDFDRETLYKNIFKFVEDNSGLIFEQFKRLGFSADWGRSVFTLDGKVIERTYETFKKMESEGLIYRDNYIVNYCVHDGTSLAELEVKHVERKDPLYYVKYPLLDTGFVTVATVRPEPIFVDTHLAVNPKDKKNNHLIGKQVKNPLTGAVMDIIGDDYVDPNFGTGIVKLTPAHDANDFSVAKRLGLPIVQAIDYRGRMIELPNKLGLNGLKVKEAREKVVGLLEDKKLIAKIDEEYVHNIITCYKCGRDLEPLTIPNWFIKVEKLKSEVKKVVEAGEIKFYPKRYKRHMLAWLDIMHDWPISRQIVWGIRIPVWYKIDRNHDNITVRWIDKENNSHYGSLIKELKNGVDLNAIKVGLQEVVVLAENKKTYVISEQEPTDGEYIQETDTFDTWFSSGQWPLVTLKESEFDTRFPTDLMGTLSEILKFWVSRMIMFSLYLKKEIPFKEVYLWSMVTDAKGVKMSKSKGNVVNPLEIVEKYGADALRMSLIYGIPAGSKVALSDNKVKGMRNFANKIWNIARFIFQDNLNSTTNKNKDDEWILSELKTTIEKVSVSLESYKLNDAADSVYDFIWHKFADIYIEKTKDRRPEAQETLVYVLIESLKLLHPFMPFVTEAIWQEGRKQNIAGFDSPLLITSSWPE